MKCASIFLCGIGLTTWLAGCAVGPEFHSPSVASPAIWGAERQDVPSTLVQGTDVDPQWWSSFHDPMLTSLIGLLARQNIDLATATERIQQGRVERTIAASQGLPALGASSSYTHDQFSKTGILGLVAPNPDAVPAYDLWQNGLSASWELDLFGRVRRAVEASDARTLEAVETRRGVIVAEIAELVQDYFELRGDQRRLSIARSNLEVAVRSTSLVRAQLANGAATRLDLEQAQAQEATTSATIPTLQAQIAREINAIGLLLAEPPRTLEAELSTGATTVRLPPEVPVGLPGTLVRRRPDVLRAEAALHESTAQLGVAMADFYPRVTLNGEVNLDGRQIANAFSMGSHGFAVGPSISLPIFEGGRLRGQLNLSKSRQREAALDFRKTVLRAWSEVDDAMTAFADEQRRARDAGDAAARNRAALSLARARYAQGETDFLDVASAEANLLQTEDAAAESDTRVALDLVGLYRALGGGWQAVEPSIPTTASAPTQLATNVGHPPAQ